MGALAKFLSGARHAIVRIPLPDNSGYSNSALCIDAQDSNFCKNVLLLDSGSASLVLFGSGSPLGMSIKRSLVEDAAGVKRSTSVSSVHLCLQSLCRTLEAQQVEFNDADERVRGLLPTNLFERVYVSNRGGFAILSPEG